MRAADPRMEAEAEEQRWGFEAAQERKRQAEARKRADAGTDAR